MYSYLSEQREDWLETPPVLYIKHEEETWHGNYTNMLQGKKTGKEQAKDVMNVVSKNIYPKEHNDTPGKCFEI